MKYALSVILGMCLLCAVALGAEKPELKDQKDRESYSLGYSFGQSLQARRVEINLDAYAAGIKDALGGTGSLLSREEIGKILSEIQIRDMAAREKEFKELALKNLSLST